MIPVFLFPQFDPVAVHLGPFGIRWYALAYIVALVLGWRLMRGLVRLDPPVATVEQVDDFLTWATLGVVLGGRLGYVLFYQPSLYAAHPLAALEVWQGGMSFHGGALGVIIAIVLFCARHRLPMLGFADRLTVVTPLGLFFGRVANFINGELWGRPAPDWLRWAVIFPRVDTLPRHPSQLYEALLEGLVLFAIMLMLSRRQSIRAHFGTLSGVFLLGYGIARSFCELFREPDAFLGYLWQGATMGQLLSLPLIVAGLLLILWARRQPATVEERA